MQNNREYNMIDVGGYTKMIANLLDGIEVRLNTDYLEHKDKLDALAEKVIYTGPIDAYFGYRLGYLEYRSVRFENELLDIPNYQGNAAVNYTDRETPWTRTESCFYVFLRLIVAISVSFIISYVMQQFKVTKRLINVSSCKLKI